jgi:hypothetical protein
MSFFDFFKRRKQEQVKKEEISLSELDLFLKKQVDNQERDIDLIRKSIKNNIENLVLELTSKKQSLQEVNLKSRKEDERLKKIVAENINFYINYLERLISDLKNLDKNLTIQEYVSKIQIIFNIFKKNSDKSVEKATILVGKEFEEISEILRIFSRDFNKIIVDNNSIFERIPILERLNNLILEFKNMVKTVNGIEEGIKKLRQDKERILNQKKSIEEEYEKFKKSEKFKRYQETLKEHESEINNLNKRLLNLKGKINLKFLLKHFHNDEKKSILLRDYQERFLETLERDNNLEIIEIIEKGLKVNFSEEIKGLKRDFEKINHNKEYVEETEKNSFEEKINEKEYKMLEISKQIDEEEKKILRLKEKNKDTVEAIKKELNSISSILIE